MSLLNAISIGPLRFIFTILSQPKDFVFVSQISAFPLVMHNQFRIISNMLLVLPDRLIASGTNSNHLWLIFLRIADAVSVWTDHVVFHLLQPLSPPSKS